MMNSKNSCCPENSLPYLPEDPNYQNKGTVVKIPIEGQDQSQTITVYTVGKGRRCVVLIHDIFGLNTGNHKKLCDFIAEKLLDSVVIAPDFFPDGGLWGTSEVRVLLLLYFKC